VGKTVMLIGSSEVSICNFRKELVYRLLNEGFNVVISSPYGSKFDELIEKGCIFVDTSMARRSKNVFRDVALLKKYVDIMREHKPDIVITYTIKPNLYGGIAAKMLDIPYIMNITGLGTEIEKSGITRTTLLTALKPLLLKSECVFFQNIAHLNLFRKMGMVNQNYKLVSGSGVNLDEHKVLPYPSDDDEINFLYVGRLMKDKGINELVEATEIAKLQNNKIKVTALGFCEESYQKQFESINDKNIVNHLEYTDDVDSEIEKCHAVILPSYHEGMSNALLEGAACGRPLLASDVAGCFETIDNDESGFLFKAKNAKDTADKMLKFAALPEKEKFIMGLKGRKKMEEEFDREKVVDAYMDEIYSALSETAHEEMPINEKEENKYAKSVSSASHV
jgi:glycosyltransferase involved in cell wall biosynthesis